MSGLWHNQKMKSNTGKRDVLKKYVGTGGPGKNPKIPAFVDTTYLKGNGKSKAPAVMPPQSQKAFGTAMSQKAPGVPATPPVKQQAVMPGAAVDQKRPLLQAIVQEQKPVVQPIVDNNPNGAMTSTTYGMSPQSGMAKSPTSVFQQMRKPAGSTEAKASPMFTQKRKALKDKMTQLTGIPPMM